ncbi:cytosolic protein [Bacillus sp. 165]|uniref:cytosolic protein n=1 Tax=Bacillus sp. 165 TaxID=1529117 RepID=UPI001ADBC3CD|nr:cytosolic protein [Bacillus sp. 165]MBO9130599.1 cytosolic protein [Bacillus sp. 165]
MGLFQKAQNFFSAHAETNDNHHDEQLKSRYYKTNTKNALKVVQEILTGLNGYKITSVSEERGEISVLVSSGKQALMIITVITIRPFETAVDFSVSTDTTMLPTDFGFSKRVILDMYERLDKQLIFIGTSLSEKM